MSNVTPDAMKIRQSQKNVINILQVLLVGQASNSEAHNSFCQGKIGNIYMIPQNLSFRYILFQVKKTPNDAVTPLRQSQFTPKMKANAVPRLLSSLV